MGIVQQGKGQTHMPEYSENLQVVFQEPQVY